MQDDTRNTNDAAESLDSSYTSGFTESIDKEMTADPMPEEKGFGNIKEYYVSCAGPTRLFSATRYGKRYMLKCLKEDFLLTPVYQQALVKEFEIGLQLEHPCICRTFAMEQLAGMGSTIVMEHVDGDTLQTLIDGKRLSRELAVRIASQLMDALAYMHSKQITHRDIKPANIMVTHIGKNVKIIDFGLSDSDLFGVLKMPAGTYRYLAPEQLLQGAVAEPKTDIYSLGMVMEDMATATGSKKLRRMSRICTVKDASQRPDSIEALRICLTKGERDLRIVSFLIALVAALVCIVAVSFFMRSHDTVVKDNNISQPDSSLEKHQDDNRIVDYNLWDK